MFCPVPVSSQTAEATLLSIVAVLRILSVRANPREARAVVIDLLAERKLLGVFWAYKGYGSVHHSRSYDPPRYIFSVAPLLSKKAMKIYLMDSEPFDIPEVGVEEWIR